MASVIQVRSGREGYLRILQTVLKQGEPVTARDQKTLDLGHTTIVLETPEDALPVGVGRGLNVRIAAVEAVQLIGGFYDTGLVERCAPQLNRFAEGAPGSTPILHGAYGTRISHQLEQAIWKIQRDRETRQAVITLWDPWLDNTIGKKDYPCTIALQLRVYRARLDLNVVMRSNDVWLGLPYDIFQFTQLQITAARVLGLHVGQYTHTAFSLHIYERNELEARSVLDAHLPSDITGNKPFQPYGIGHPGDTIGEVKRRCRALASNCHLDRMTSSEGWYGEYLTADPASVMGSSLGTDR